MHIKESKSDSVATFKEQQLVSFMLGHEEFAVDILNIQSINRIVEMTKIPNSPSYVEGIINLRGKIIPIIDLRRRLNMKVEEHNKETRFIVVDINNRIVGFIVDSVCEVLRLDGNKTEPPPHLVSNVDSAFITAVGKLKDRLLILIDIEKIFSIEEKEVLSKLEYN
jgi:purine-binding chemotaxis protein CheW